MTEDEVKGLFTLWNNALQSGNPKQVTALYAEDAVLLPTISNRIRSNPDAIEAYFVDFLARSPQGRLDQSHIRIFETLAVHSGIYTFSFADGSQVQARFTYLYQSSDNDWKIIEHHSSAMPE